MVPGEEFAISESNRLLARPELAGRGDDARETGLVLKLSFPRGLRVCLKSSKHEDPDLIRLRKLIRKRLRTMNNSITRPPHHGQWLASPPLRSRPRAALCRRRSRSSRRRARIARAARRATADPDGASVYERQRIAEPPPPTWGFQ